MKKILSNNKFIYYSLILIAITLPLPMLINNIAIILFIITTLVHIFYTKNSFKFTKIHFAFITFFLISFISLYYTCNVNNGFKNLEKYLSFLVFPILISTIKISKEQLKHILLVFAITTLLLFIVAILIATYNSIETKSFIIYNPLNKVNENYFFYHRLSKNVGFHAIYLGILMVFSNVIFIENLISTKKNKSLLVIAIAITSIGIILLQSFSVIFSYIIILLSFIIYYYKNISFKSKILLFIISTFIILFSIKIFIKKAKTFNQNFLLYTFSDDIDNRNWNSLNIRLAKWECAIEVAHENFPLGTGLGCQQIQLNKKYNEKGFVIGMDKKFSTHNQYLHNLVQTGILGLIILLLLYYLSIYTAIKTKNLVFLSLAILLIFTSVTENILSRNKGIVLFVFFISLFSKKESLSKF